MRPRLDLFYDKRYSHTKMTNPDFILLAQSMGVHAIKCRTAEELPAKMKEFLEYDGSRPVLMECLVEKNEHVFPMVRNQFDCWLFLKPPCSSISAQVPAGKALHEQMMHPSLAGVIERMKSRVSKA